MGARVVFTGPSWYSTSSSSPNRVVLACLLMFLWVQVGFHKDVDFTFPRPVPVDDLSSKCGDIGVVQLVVSLFEARSFLDWGEAVDQNLVPLVVEACG